MRVKATLYVTDHRARVRIRRGNVLVEQPEGRTRVPIERLEGVVLVGRAEVTNAALGEFMKRGIRVAALSTTGRLRFWVGGPTSGNVHLRLAQYARSSDPLGSAEVARILVAGKLWNCREMIQRWGWDADDLRREVFVHEAEMLRERIHGLEGVVDGDRIRGIEGDGSRRYFKCMAIHVNSGEHRFTFERRTRRPPRDPVNAVLSFVYALVLGELIGALDAVGLDPQIGFLHRPRSGRPGLALDLLEELRPAVADRFSLALVGRGRLRPEHFEVVGEGHYLTDAGRRILLEAYEAYRSEEVVHPLLRRPIGRWAIPTVQATLMARFIRGDLPAYPPFVTRS